MENKREMLRLMGQLLEYPGPDLVEKTRRCEKLLEGADPRAALSVAEFAAFAEGERPDRLEEIYSATFDLNPECYPYAGYQLFGEDPKRSALMVGLQHSYCRMGFDIGGELPDYVPVLLRFLSELRGEELERELADLILAPALEKMAGNLESKQNPYARAVRAAAAIVALQD